MRIGPLITGVLATTLALVVLAIGGGFLVIDEAKDGDGYLATDTETFSTETSALATENIDLDLDGAGWVVGAEDFGKVRLRVTSAGDQPLFVGVARTGDVERYLDGSAHVTLSDIESGPFDATYEESFGRRRLGAPARSSIWEARTTGTGEQDLVWDVEDGNWSVVVMNADGSPGVTADVSAGAKLPDLAPLGWSTIGGGALLMVGGIVAIVLASRPKRTPAPRAAVAAA